jgi:hypothetical protein
MRGSLLADVLKWLPINLRAVSRADIGEQSAGRGRVDQVLASETTGQASYRNRHLGDLDAHNGAIQDRSGIDRAIICALTSASRSARSNVPGRSTLI